VIGPCVDHDSSVVKVHVWPIRALVRALCVRNPVVAVERTADVCEHAATGRLASPISQPDH
jgi:hypothetical protein